VVGNTQLVLQSDARELIGSEMLEPKEDDIYGSRVER